MLSPTKSRPEAGRPRSTVFKKGTSGNPSGRRPGTHNRITTEAREAAALIVDDPAYRAALKARVIAGQAPQMEPLLWAYAKGKPVERVEHGGPGAFAALTDAELRKRLLAALDGFSRAVYVPTNERSTNMEIE